MVLVYAFWVAIIALATLLLVHLGRLGLLVRYPFFFAYLGVATALNLGRWMAYHWWNPHYPWVYWVSELFLVLSCFLGVCEVYRQTFSPFPSIRRVVSWAILVLVLLVLGAHILLNLTGAIHLGWYQLFFQLERWLRFTQAGLLAFLVASARHYRLPLGRNVAGLATGFGLYVSLIVVGFAFQALEVLDLEQLSHFYAVTYLLTLGIWLYAFHVYAPNPLPQRSTHLEQDYARLNAAVISALLGLRAGLRKAREIS